jgi:hypothetical protein
MIAIEGRGKKTESTIYRGRVSAVPVHLLMFVLVSVVSLCSCDHQRRASVFVILCN